MEENLQKLLESNYFSTKESEIINIINKKCSKDLSNSLEIFLKEIDDALNSDFTKQQESRFDETEKESYEIIHEIQGKIQEIKEIKTKGKVVTELNENIFHELLEKYAEINTLEAQYKLFEIQESQMELISYIQSSLILDDIFEASEHLVDLINNIQLSDNDNNERQKLILERLFIYHRLVKGELTKRLEECLKDINWPYISNNLQQVNPELETNKIDSISDKFSSTFKQLYLIEIPDHLLALEDREADLINTKFMVNFTFDRISFPIQLLLKPLVKYFKFFFWTDSKVNKLSKPEWYMTQVIQWIAAHHMVLGELFNETILEPVDGRLEFIRGLVIMVMEKVQKDIELISTCSQNNDDLFFHLIEESLNMATDLRKSFDYPRSYPDPIDVICNSNETFENWMKIEHRFAAKQLDEVFRDAGAWRAVSSQCKRVECLNSFIGLINTTKERIQCIFDISKQTRFCEILLEVLDDFRRRLLQISKDYNGNSQRWYDIMNVVYSVKVLLRNWRLDQVFIGIYENNKAIRISRSNSVGESNESHKLEARQTRIASLTTSSLYSSRTRTIENLKLSTDSVFSDTISLYQHLLEEMEEQCINSAFEDVSERADAYIKSSWLEIGSVVAPRLMSLSPSASGMLLVLRDRLHGLESALEPELFEHIWQELATRLSKLLFNSVIRGHKFNEMGASQLDFDLKKNLLPLFLPYTRTPDRFFYKCLEACNLLTLKCGTAMLIKQILTDSLHEESSGRIFNRSRPECPIRALSEIGVLSLIPEEAEYILNLRVDTNLS